MKERRGGWGAARRWGLLLLGLLLAGGAPLPVWAGTSGGHAGLLPLRMIVLRTVQEARDVAAAVSRGVPFERLVHERSIGPEREHGGYLGWVNPATLSGEAQAALARTRVGRLTPIFPAEDGYAMFQLLSEPAARSLEERARREAEAERQAEQLLAEGTEAGKQGDLPRAVELLGRAAALNPRLVDAHYNLAIGARRLGRMPEAVAAMRRVLELLPDDFEARMGLGGWLAEAGQHAEAVQHYERAAMIRMDSRDAWLRLGQSYEADGRYRDALGAYRRALTLLGKDDPAILGVILRVAMRGRDGAVAVDAARRLQPFSPGHGGFTLLGRALLLAGETSAAILELEKAVALAPASVPARLALSEAYAAAGKPQAAVDQLTRVIRQEPGEPRHYRLLSERYEEIDRLDLAIVAMRDGVAASADRPRAVQAEMSARLALLYELAGMLREATRERQRAELLEAPSAR